MRSATHRTIVSAVAGVLAAAALTVTAATPSEAVPLTRVSLKSAALKTPMAPNPVAVDGNGNQVAVEKAPIPQRRRANSTPSHPGPAGGATVVVDDVVSPESIIGADNRVRVTATTSYPNRAIVHITRNGEAHCTGWMVSKDTLVTAGHCLYNRSTASWYTGLAFTPGRNGSTAPYGTANASRRITDTNYINNGDTRQDWGIVKLDRAIGNSTGWFGLKWQSSSYNGTSGTVRGYPGDKSFGTLWSMTGTVAQSTSNGLCYSMDTMGGQSGSPVYNGSNQGIAIHTMGTGGHGLNGCSTSYNAATRITQSLYNLIQAEIAK